MKRRDILQYLLATALGGAWVGRSQAAAPTVKGRDIDALQKNWEALLPPGTTVPLPGDALVLSKDEWRKRLTPAAYDVLREEGTERPESSPLNLEKRPGVFACAGCGLPLFTSAMKYDSGTGWPSFFTAIPGMLATKKDRKLFTVRTEYHCVRCGGHQGHVFDDGPAPTHQRWCNNGVALKFLAKS
jgi:peptide-methionine (R)-S-oxide reductase